MGWRTLAMASLAPALTARVLHHRRRRIARPTEHPARQISSDLSIKTISRFRFLGFFPLAVLGWYVLVKFAAHVGFGDGGESITLSPDAVIWTLPGLFLSFSLGTLLQDIYFRRAGADVYPFPGEAAYRKRQLAEPAWHLHIASAVTVVSIWILQSAQACFSASWIEVGSVFPWFPSTYAYREVESITTYEKAQMPSGRVGIKPSISIGFSDGVVWDSNELLTELSAGRSQRLANFVSERSGVAVERRSIR